MSLVFTYQSISAPVETLLKEKGSKFFGFAYPVKNEEEIKQYLEQLREVHTKATHHCYAWRLGLDKNNYRANDDGEPSGTAGKPILGQIDSYGLTNCLVVSVRYFGGTKLGVPGLISAYKLSAKETLAIAEIQTHELYHEFNLYGNYQHLNMIYQWVQQYEGVILEQNLTDSCHVKTEIPLSLYASAVQNIASFYPIDIQFSQP